MIPGKSLSSVSVSRLFYCSGDMSSITDLEIINHYGCGLVLVARAAIQSLLHRSDRSCVNFFFQILSIIYILRASDSIKSASKVDSTTLQRLWSRGYDSRLGLSSDIKCERSQVRVLATACSFAFCGRWTDWRGGYVSGVWGKLKGCGGHTANGGDAETVKERERERLLTSCREAAGIRSGLSQGLDAS